VTVMATAPVMPTAPTATALRYPAPGVTIPACPHAVSNEGGHDDD
jgi:hypothetical protein